jgi:hypothetical protein
MVRDGAGLEEESIVKISDQKWNEIVAETQAAIEKWNAQAAREGWKDSFRCRLSSHADGNVTLITEHDKGWHIERRAVTRIGDQMYRSTIAKAKGGIAIKTKTDDSKAFAALADKPTKEIVKKAGLTDFFVMISAQLTHVRSETFGGEQ